MADFNELDSLSDREQRLTDRLHAAEEVVSELEARLVRAERNELEAVTARERYRETVKQQLKQQESAAQALAIAQASADAWQVCYLREFERLSHLQGVLRKKTVLDRVLWVLYVLGSIAAYALGAQ